MRVFCDDVYAIAAKLLLSWAHARTMKSVLEP